MDGTVIAYYENYIPVGDILVLSICLTFVILIHAAYVNRTTGFLIFRHLVTSLAIAAALNLIFHIGMNALGSISSHPLYLLRISYHAALYAHFFLYILYIGTIMHLEKAERRIYVRIGGVGFIALLAFEFFGFVFRYGFYIDETLTAHRGFPFFSVGYVFYLGVVLFMAVRFRERIYTRILLGVLQTVGMSFLLIVTQDMFNQKSFTAASFLFPMLALMYLVHANPYDLEIGAVNAAGFEDRVRVSLKYGRELLMMSILLPEYETSGRRFSEDIHKTIRHFASTYFKDAVLFQVSSGRMILTMETRRNPDYEEKVRESLEQFRLEHDKFKLEHKIVITKTIDSVSEQNDYVGLIQYVERHMPENTVHMIARQDVENYMRHHRLIRQLAEIYNRGDLEDEHIEAYCQPVLNLRTGRYDTAETLMRLRLGESELIMPEDFIPLAEEYGYITVLSRIILNKTCAAVHRLLEDGYRVERISVNFSMIDLRDPEFCPRITGIIRDNGIPSEKIAIELTESQNEKDFMLAKEKISELHESGVKFYLDDFGTGYSNFERIMELPFDIIKFDRSLVVASATDPESETMVSYLARMFNDMDYAVLYEGIENAEDEKRCAGMCARYLQGYRYSMPIPIERLTEFFDLAAC